jgi:hypothetical protein
MVLASGSLDRRTGDAALREQVGQRGPRRDLVPRVKSPER